MAPSTTTSKGKSKAAASSTPAPAASAARKTRSSVSSVAAASPKQASVTAKAKEPKPTSAAKKQADKAMDAKAVPKARLPSAKEAKKGAEKVAAVAERELETMPAAKEKGAEKGKAKRAREEEEVVGAKAKKSTAAAAKEKKAPAAAAPKAPVSILKKPKAAAAAAVVAEPTPASDDDEEEEEDAESDGPILRGLSVSGSEDGANSSDEDDEDDAAPLPPVDTVRLPSSRNDKDVKARLEQVAKKRKAGGEAPTPSVLYFGRLPKSFIEPALRSYLAQFGDVLRLRVARNKRTGASKHYAFVEFADADVARIVRETMDGYLIDGRLMQVRDVPAEKVHPTLWVGAGKTWRKVPKDRVARMQHDKPKDAESRTKVEEKLLARQEKRRSAIKAAGIDYEFDGYSR